MTTVTISIDPTYKMFASLPQDQLAKVAVGIGPHGMNVSYLVYNAYELNYATMGDAAVNPCSWAVSYRRPLTMSREAFAVFGNVKVTDYASSRLGSILADYVKRGVLTVRDDATTTDLTPEQILTFTP